METINLNYFNKCISTLELAYQKYQASDSNSIENQLFRSACVKEFEIIIELSVQLLRKKLMDYEANKRAVQTLTYKNVLRQAAAYGILETEVTELWMAYRDLRNQISHEYGENFATEFIAVLPDFIASAKKISSGIEDS